MSKAFCYRFLFTENCGYLLPSSTGTCYLKELEDSKVSKFEFFGPSSRCFLTSARDRSTPIASCLESSCRNNKLYFKMADTGEEKECQSTGQVVTTSSSGTTVTCPNISEFCGFLNQGCPNDCNGSHGICLEGKTCYCLSGYSGADCV